MWLYTGTGTRVTVRTECMIESMDNVWEYSTKIPATAQRYIYRIQRGGGGIQHKNTYRRQGGIAQRYLNEDEG